MEFTPLECDILKWIASHCDDPAITRQLQNVRPVSRDYTGHGFFIRLELIGECPRVARRTSAGEPHIDSPELDEYGAGCVLFFENGNASVLELYANADDFPENLTSWTLV